MNIANYEVIDEEETPKLRVNKFKKKYDLHELIGKGAFGNVYRITDKLTNEQFAVKVYFPLFYNLTLLRYLINLE